MICTLRVHGLKCGSYGGSIKLQEVVPSAKDVAQWQSPSPVCMRPRIMKSVKGEPTNTSSWSMEHEQDVSSLSLHFSLARRSLPPSVTVELSVIKECSQGVHPRIRASQLAQ